MNLIEALKKADGKPVARKAWIIGADRTLRLIRDGQRMCWLGGIGDDWREARIGFFTDSALYADDWYVVVEKSKIEEAIAFEIDIAQAANFGVNLIYFNSRLRKIANLTLDEAKKAAVGRNGELDDTSACLAPVYVCERIDALKVKE